MENTLVGFLSLGGLALVNIAVVAYASGKLWQKVKDIADRVTRIEEHENGRLGRPSGG